MSRQVEEWRGKTDDTPIPPRVRARVFLAHGGVCHISGRKIGPADKWDCDHVQALCNGGENRESNLAPALRDRHREKTADDVKQRAKADRVRAKFLGIHPPSKRKIPSRPFQPGRNASGRALGREDRSVRDEHSNSGQAPAVIRRKGE